MNARTILCPICGAQPGKACIPAPAALEVLNVSHWLRKYAAGVVPLVVA